MQRERVADDIYVFTSDVYAQVTAGAVITSDGAILIDTLLFPDETRSIRLFVEGRLGCPIKYVINTHYHADHTYGTCFFPNATVVSHSRCYDLLDSRGRTGLEKAQIGMPELNEVQVVLPHLVFDHKVMNLHLGNRTLQMWHTPGHSPDSIVCLVKEDRVLFAGDTLMPVPYFVDGDYEDLVRSLRSLQGNSFENIVQGHGEVILRGEIEERIESDLRYLASVRRYVETARTKADPVRYLNHIDIERCGKSRIPLNGDVQQLHHANLRALYRHITGQIVEESAPQSSYETPDR
jgi:glyoxylase-like metal-dependent hydrolase (beta-lactamase superfamily II)